MTSSKFTHARLLKKGAFLLIAATFFLAGCLDDDRQTTEPLAIGYVSIYHAAPDAPGLDIIIDNERINSDAFDYSDHSGYLNFLAGDRNFRFSSHNAANTLVDTAFRIAGEASYSVFVTDTLESIAAFIVRDSAAAPAAGKAMVRFIHLSPDAPAVDVNPEGESDALFSNTAFRQASAFKEVDAGTYGYHFVKAGTGEEVISEDNVTLREGGYHTVIMRGLTDPPAGNTNILSVHVLY